MANPSLQIGNDNWAIKEDNLLGYSTAGTRFVPQPITMTRATLGTRVNPSGLVEDVALLGSELVTNGSFTTDSDWDKTGTWSIESNYATASGNSTSQYIQQDFTITNGKTYLFTYEIIENTLNGNGSSLSGSGGFVSVSLSSVIGTHQVYITADDSGAAYALKIGVSGTATTGTIKLDNVSVKEATINNLPRVDYTDGTSSLLVEPQRRNLVTYSEVISNLNSLTNGAGTYTITDNYTDSPEGVQNASRVQMSIVDTNDTNNYRLINTGSVMTNGVTREISFYAKSLTGLNQDVLAYWSYDQQIVTLTNDWQRFEISGTSANSGAVFIGTRGGSGNYFSGGDANLDFALWGLQVEDDASGGGSSYATSYIKTSGGTVTRVQETYEKSGISDKIGQTEGTFFIELSKPVLETDGYYLISLNNAASNSDSNSVTIGFDDADDDFYIRLKASGINVFLDNLTSSLANTFYKIAVAYKSGQSKIYINGSPINPNQGSLSNTFTFAVTLDNLSFDYNGNGTLPFRGNVKQLQIFKTALSPSELTTLTT